MYSAMETSRLISGFGTALNILVYQSDTVVGRNMMLSFMLMLHNMFFLFVSEIRWFVLAAVVLIGGCSLSLICVLLTFGLICFAML